MINTSIKRLTKPKFKHEFTTLYDSKHFQAIPLFGSQLDEVLALEDTIDKSSLKSHSMELYNSNDVSYDGVEADAALNYNPTFGKICTGENFRVLFTLMNTNA